MQSILLQKKRPRRRKWKLLNYKKKVLIPSSSEITVADQGLEDNSVDDPLHSPAPVNSIMLKYQ
jgi:hypothetical protein